MELSTAYDDADDEELRYATLHNNRDINVEVVKLPTPTAPPESFYEVNPNRIGADNIQYQTDPPALNNETAYKYFNADNPFEVANDTKGQAKQKSGQKTEPEFIKGDAKGNCKHGRKKGALTVQQSMSKVELSWIECKNYYKDHYNFDVLDFSTKKDLNAIYADGFRKDQFFTEEEIEALKWKPMPVDHTTVLTSSEWNALRKKSKHDSTRFGYNNVIEDHMHDGVMAADDDLEDSDDISQFFIHNNYRPRLFLHVSVDTKGTTFRSTIDLTEYIFPFGKLLYVGNLRSEKDDSHLKSLYEIFDDYLDSDNKLKCLQMTKKVFFDFETLTVLVKEYLSLQYDCSPSQIKCKITQKRISVRLVANTGSNKFWDSVWGRTVAGITIVPAIAMSIYAEEGRWRDLRSHFTILYTPFQLFHLIRSNLSQNK